MFEEIGVFYRGLLIGLGIAAPVGPIGLLCIRRTVSKGIGIGFATGFGAALADGLFAVISALGVAAIIEFIHHYDFLIRIIGGFILLGVAAHTWQDHLRQPKVSVFIHGRSINMPKPADASLFSAIKAILSGFFITASNPLTVLGTFAVIATFGHLQNGEDGPTLVVGVFLGSVLWWALLAGGTTLVREHFTERGIMIMNKVIAIVLAAFALWAVTTGAQGYFHFQF